jgi:acyl carrier protein
MENFESSISEILEVDTIDLNDELESFDAWDSLAVLSIIAFCDSDYNVELTGGEIENTNTINGLKELIKSKM